MLAKTWKQIGLIILIIACIINIMSKSVTKMSFTDQIKDASSYIQEKVKK